MKEPVLPATDSIRRGGPQLVCGVVGLALSLLAQGCASTRAAPKAAVPVRTDGDSFPAPAPAPPPQASGSGSRLGSPPVSLQRLASAVNSLDDTPPDANHRALVQALRDLGIAIAQLPGVSTARVAEMLDTAQRLESAPASSYLHADLLKKGLAAALGALLARSGSAEGTPYRTAQYRDVLANLGMAIDSIRGDRPLLDQRKRVADTFRAATDAVYLASALRPPFPEAMAGAERPVSPALDQELSDAQAALLELGQARWPNARSAVARALFALADVVQSLQRETALGEKANEIRRQAERLSSAELLTLDQTKWLVTGLLSALDALDTLPPERAAFIAAWRSAARKAIAGLSQGDTLAFQAAAVQDGFRATLDAFVAASQAKQACR